MKYKIICILLAITLLLLTAGCSSTSNTVAPTSSVSTSSSTPQAIPKKIGILLPDSSRYWTISALRLQQQLEENGCIADVQYANDSWNVQASQMKNMITNDYDVFVIAVVDEGALEELIVQAKEKDVPVIAYARPFWGDEDVSHSVLFDSENIGIQFGKYIEEKLDLKNAPGSFNIELFSGDSGSSMLYAHFHHNGLMEFLQPYFDNGQLIVPSKQIWEETATEGFATEKAYERMKELIASQSYGPESQKKRLDAVICIDDSTARGVSQALLEAGYTADNFPIITGGMDPEIESVKNIIAGKQSMSFFYDPTILADRVARMITSILNGEEPEINDTETYGKFIPTYVCDPVVVTRENYREVLIDSGYFTEEELMD